MALKNFDFKGLMLKHGQYVALGVGLIVLLPLMVMGLGKVFSSGRASANANVLLDSQKRANGYLQTSRPPEDAAKPPQEFFVDLKVNPIDPAPYDTDSPWYVPSTVEDSRRRNPEVLLVSDLQGELIRGAIESYLVVQRGKDLQAAVLTDKSAAIKPTKKQKAQMARLEKILKNQGLGSLLNQQGGAGANGFGPGGPGGMGAMGGGRGIAGGGMGMGAGLGGMGAMGGGRGIVGGGGMGMGAGPGGMGAKGDAGGFGGGGLAGGMLGSAPGQRMPGTVRRTEYVDLDKIGDQRLAQDINPKRMIVISGAFPYRKELEEFRSKLRKHSLTELMSLIDSGDATFAFQGFQIDRQVYGRDGKVIQPWTDHTQNMLDTLTGIYALAVDFQDEDQQMKDYGMINEGLVAPRPLLARDAKYPPTEIKSLKDAMHNLEKQMTPDSKKPLSDLARKLRGGKGVFDPFNPLNPFRQDDDNDPAQAANKNMPNPSKPGEPNANASEDPDADLMVPDRVLVRLIDIVEPGYTYEYRIKAKMKNPNFKRPAKEVAYPALTKPETLLASDWSMVPKIEVPSDTFWYAVDSRPGKDTINLQFHRWVDYILPSSDMSAANSQPVGDWCIVERQPTHRGEYIGRVENVEVPVWSPEAETYEIYKPRKGSRLTPVDFSVAEKGPLTPRAVLIDYSGGKGHQTKIWDKAIREDLPLDLLVLNADGKLILRNSVDDEENKDRVAREDDWREWHAKVRRGLAGRQQAQPLTQPGAGAGKFGGGR